MSIRETYFGATTHPYSDWMPLMSSIWYPTVASVLYLICCHSTSICRSIDTSYFHSTYNATRIFTQFILGCFLIYYGIRARLPLFCAPIPDGVSVGESPYSIKIAWALWAYYMVKLSDLLDCFFILRTERTIGYMMMYHHISLLYLTWLSIRFIPGGSTIYPVIINSFAQFGFYLFHQYNKGQPRSDRVSFVLALNTSQAIQFSIIVIHSMVQVFKPDCMYPILPSIGIIIYIFSFFLLTLVFYEIHICAGKCSTD